MRRAAPDKAGTPVEDPERSDGLRHAAAGLEGRDAHLPDRVPEATPLHLSTVTIKPRQQRRLGEAKRYRTRSRSEEETSEIKSLMLTLYAVICVKKKKKR